MWRHNDLTTATDPNAPLTTGRPFGYAFEQDESQHVVYRGADDHIHELHWKSGREGPNWRHNDLTTAPDPNAPLTTGNPFGYAFEEDESQHVVYRGTDDHIYELHWKSGREGPNWRHNDLTTAPDANAPLTTGNPFGYAFEQDESQHVVYRGTDDHIYELHWKSGRGWRLNDLTTAPDPNAPLTTGNPFGYAFEQDESQHVVYRGADDHIYELHWKSGRGWRLNDLTTATDPNAPLTTGDPFGYAFEEDASQHVVYRSATNHIHELQWKSGRGWRHTDLSTATDPVAPLTTGNPFGYAFEQDESQHVVYRGTDDHIYELNWKSGRGWRLNDLTTATDPNAPLTTGNPFGYAFEEDESQHVVYRGADDHIHELHWKIPNGSWVTDVLGFFGTVIAGAVDVITTIANAIIETVESAVGWIASALAFLAELIFSIPVVGRILKWIWNVILTVVWSLVGLGDLLLALIGILPEKKLRICVNIMRDELGDLLDTPANLVPQVQNAIDIFRREANVRVIRSAPLQYDSGFADSETATEDWIHTGPRGRNDSSVLDVACGTAAAGEDLLTPGSAFELRASTNCFYSNARRVLGYGAPVIVFIVRSVAGEGGCSLGPLSDYVVVEANRSSDSNLIAHELGHSCNLWHFNETDNMMDPDNAGFQLTRFQVAMLRNSRHVTYS